MKNQYRKFHDCSLRIPIAPTDSLITVLCITPNDKEYLGMLLQIHALAGHALALLLGEMLEFPDSKKDKH
jgi:hypothetical protein